MKQNSTKDGQESASCIFRFEFKIFYNSNFFYYYYYYFDAVKNYCVEVILYIDEICIQILYTETERDT